MLLAKQHRRTSVRRSGGCCRLLSSLLCRLLGHCPRVTAEGRAGVRRKLHGKLQRGPTCVRRNPCSCSTHRSFRCATVSPSLSFCVGFGCGAVCERRRGASSARRRHCTPLAARLAPRSARLATRWSRPDGRAPGSSGSWRAPRRAGCRGCLRSPYCWSGRQKLAGGGSAHHAPAGVEEEEEEGPEPTPQRSNAGARTRFAHVATFEPFMRAPQCPLRGPPEA